MTADGEGDEMAKRALEAWEKSLVMGRDHLLRLAATVSVAIPFWFALSALGTRWGWWDWRHGLITMTRDWGFTLVLTAVVLALIGLYCVLVVRPWGGRRLLAVAFAVPVLAFAALGAAMGKASGVPPIHDIGTDTANPPAFSPALLAERGDKANKVLPPTSVTIPFNPERLTDWSGSTVAEAQARAYPDIKTLTPGGCRTGPDLLTLAEQTLRRQGYETVRRDDAGLRLEATARTFWFGFRDDMVVRINASGGCATLDARSVSRVGVSDLGANAARVRKFLAAVRSPPNG
jgi:Protein of unknown function (DUF1499)